LYNIMKIKHYIYLIIFLATYLLSITSVLYTETLILLSAVAFIFILWITTHVIKFEIQEDDFKWNETILFYIILKNWHRSIMRDTDIRIVNFLLLFVQIQKYEIEWMKKNIEKVNKRDYMLIQGLEILASYKNIIKTETSVFGLRRLPLTAEILSYDISAAEDRVNENEGDIFGEIDEGGIFGEIDEDENVNANVNMDVNMNVNENIISKKKKIVEVWGRNEQLGYISDDRARQVFINSLPIIERKVTRDESKIYVDEFGYLEDFLSDTIDDASNDKE
jgi:hypothetical protein